MGTVKTERGTILARDMLALNHLRSIGLTSLAAEFQANRKIPASVANAYRTLTCQRVLKTIDKKIVQITSKSAKSSEDRGDLCSSGVAFQSSNSASQVTDFNKNYASLGTDTNKNSASHVIDFNKKSASLVTDIDENQANISSSFSFSRKPVSKQDQKENQVPRLTKKAVRKIGASNYDFNPTCKPGSKLPIIASLEDQPGRRTENRFHNHQNSEMRMYVTPLPFSPIRFNTSIILIIETDR